MHIFAFIISIFLWWIGGTLTGMYFYKFYRRSLKRKKILMQIGAISALFAGLLSTLALGTDSIVSLILNLFFALITAGLFTLPMKRTFRLIKKYNKKNKKIELIHAFHLFQISVDNFTNKILSFFLRLYS